MSLPSNRVNTMKAKLNSLLTHPLVEAVRAIASTHAAPAVLVGGALRDRLLGRQPHDFDFAVLGDAVMVARGLANAMHGDFYVMDAERGTARVLVSNAESTLPDNQSVSSPVTGQARFVLDFSVCRGATWDDDLRARDFTMNAIALDLATGAVVDATRGLDDIARHVVRAASAHAVSDDPVRALRAVRMAFQFGFEIEPATLAQLRMIGGLILQPSAERLRDELFSIFDLANAAHATQYLDDLNLLTHLVPEIEPMRAQAQSAPHRFTVLEHTWRVMEALDKTLQELKDDASGMTLGVDPQHIAELNASVLSVNAEERSGASVLRFATLLHDCAKPITVSVDSDSRLHFYGHERAGAPIAAARARALKLTSDEVKWVRTFIANHMRPNQMARMPLPPTPRVLVRFFTDTAETAPVLALFALADCWGKRGEDTTIEACGPSQSVASTLITAYYTRFEKSIAPTPLITGQDLLDLGLPQSRRIGEILRQVREAQLAGEIESHEQAREMARGLMA